MNKIEISNENKFSFNFKKFKEFKKRLHIYFENKYGESINQKFPNKETKEALYKYVLGFEGKTDVFRSGRKQNIEDFDLPEDIIILINDLKEETKKILYSE